MAIKRKYKGSTFDPEVTALALKMAFDDDRSYPKFIEHLIKKEAVNRGIKI
jgi:hypothetical protein